MRIARATARSLGGLLFVYFFIVLLMVLVTEESVIVRLHQLDSQASYTSALASLDEDPARIGAIAGQSRALRVLERQIASEQSEVDQAQIGLDATMSRLRTIALHYRSACMPTRDLADPSAVDWLWGELRFCAEGVSPPRLQDQLDATQGQHLEIPNAPTQRDRLRALSLELRQASGQLTATTNDLQRRLNEHNALAPTRALFAEIRALQASGLFGAAFLLNFPPALLQLPLAIVAGAFGAVLLRLILLVYPNSTLRTSEKGGIVRRATLGGLVALSVYILLLGGTAIVGASGGLQNQQSNSLTFTAVAILAGMFSDRVAGWLSNRADGFFSGGAKPSREPPPPS
jgi:hypothetical protein